MKDRIKAYIVMACLIAAGIVIGKAQNRREIVYVVRQ